MNSFIKKSSDTYGRILVRPKFCENGVSRNCKLFGILRIYMGEVSYDRLYVEPEFSKENILVAEVYRGGGITWGQM